MSFAGGVNIISAIIGIVAAIVVGYLFFVSSRRMDLRKLFTISSFLLLFIAAGLAAHGVHEFEEAGVVSGIVSPLYDVNHIIDEDGVFGSFLKGIFGYNGNPSLLEVLIYIGYFGSFYYLIFVRNVKKSVVKPDTV